jgi:hypothetical protein
MKRCGGLDKNFHFFCISVIDELNDYNILQKTKPGRKEVEEP